ncbi:MAG: AraC family transcriptional regulator [Bacteroidota bacterium]
MIQADNIPIADVFYSCTERKISSIDYYLGEHILIHVLDGKLVTRETDKSYTIYEGETILVARNQLPRFTKYPSADKPYKSIVLFFSQPFLQTFFSSNLKNEEQNKMPMAHTLKKHPLLDSLFKSIVPYYELSENLPEKLITMKLTEAITILRQIDISTDSILADFGAPGKIDIAEFMQKNFAVNIQSDRFAYLTGRSLATFKRDFQKAFNTSPQKWLHQKRLAQAHFLIGEKKQKPSDVYLAVGFENFSHFSFAFKKEFGYNPSEILSLTANNH